MTTQIIHPHKEDLSYLYDLSVAYRQRICANSPTRATCKDESVKQMQ